MIYLIRHCTPNIDYSRSNYQDAILKVDEYNSTENVKVSEIKKFTSQINKITKLPKLKVFCSTSPRSFRTAKEIFNNSPHEISLNNQFIEFDLRVFQIPLVKLKLKTWLFNIQNFVVCRTFTSCTLI